MSRVQADDFSRPEVLVIACLKFLDTVSLFARGNSFIDITNGQAMNPEEDKIFLCLAALLTQYFCRFTNGGAKISTYGY